MFSMFFSLKMFFTFLAPSIYCSSISHTPDISFIPFSSILLPISKDKLKLHNINPDPLLNSRDELAVRKFWNFPSGIIHFALCCSLMAVLSDIATCSFAGDCDDMERRIDGTCNLHYQLNDDEEQR